MGKYWEIEEGRVDSARFFEALWRRFPDATTFYAEGSSIARDVKDCFRVYQEKGEYLPAAQTIFPRSDKFRCRFSSSLAVALSALAQTHAEPELLDHLALYRESQELLFWHDAFANVLVVSRSVPENVVSAFAADLGLAYSSGREFDPAGRALMNRVLWFVAGLTISIIPIVIVPFAGYLLGWIGAIIGIVLAGMVPAYWYGRRTALDTSKPLRAALCLSCGLGPLLFGIYWATIHSQDPLGLAYLVLAISASSAALCGAFLVPRPTAT